MKKMLKYAGLVLTAEFMDTFLGCILMFVGLGALCAIDSIESVGLSFIVAIAGIVTAFCGGLLLCMNDDISDID